MTRGTVSAVVTTVRRGQKFAEANRALAARTAAELGIPNVPRGSDSLDEMRTAYGVDAVLVARRGLLTAVTAEGELFFHPGMAHLRIKNLRSGQGDHLVHALGLTEGMCVLDCTLGSYDAVYFDPMFRRPVHESEGMNALRVLADARALTAEVIAEARRVARRRVVMKERQGSREFARLGFTDLAGGKYSRIAYGVMEIP